MDILVIRDSTALGCLAEIKKKGSKEKRERLNTTFEEILLYACAAFI